MKSILFAFTFALATFPSAVSTAFANDDIIRASCKSDLKLSDSGCDCVIKAVESELTSSQKEALALMVGPEQSTFAQALSEGKISGEDMTVLSNFMATTPANCQDK